MHFVAALDRVEGMRCVLGLFEGVVTGAADGYFRMKGTPASTLLHLGPGLANGLANLHNAKKANSGIVNIVGQHADLPHRLQRAADLRHRGPGAADVGLGANLAGRQIGRRRRRRGDRRRQERAAADRDPDPARRHRLERGRRHRRGRRPTASARAIPPQAVDEAAKVLRNGGAQTLLLMTGSALTEHGLALAAQIAGKTGCKVMGQTYQPADGARARAASRSTASPTWSSRRCRS